MMVGSLLLEQPAAAAAAVGSRCALVEHRARVVAEDVPISHRYFTGTVVRCSGSDGDTWEYER